MTTAIILIVLVVLVVIALAAFWSAKRKRESAALQDRFGPEYDRAVAESGNRRQAEHHLSDVAATRDKAEIRELDPQERERYSQRWTGVQAAFVDDPVGATRDADVLVGDVMRDRGYPLDDVENRADLVAADHAELAGHYREAHAVGQRADDASTEELRQAFVHYRALFVELLAEPHGRHEHGTAGTTGAAPTLQAPATQAPASQAPATQAPDRGLDGRPASEQVDVTDGERTRQAPPA